MRAMSQQAAEDGTMAYITMVKKIKRNGEPCGKCRDIEARLKREGHFDKINRVVIAREGDFSSEGMRLAEIYQVDRAPFFLVADESGQVSVYTVYYRFARDWLKTGKRAPQSLQDLMELTPDLDFV
jgi:hypothetical protein